MQIYDGFYVSIFALFLSYFCFIASQIRKTENTKRQQRVGLCRPFMFSHFRIVMRRSENTTWRKSATIIFRMIFKSMILIFIKQHRYLVYLLKIFIFWQNVTVTIAQCQKMFWEIEELTLLFDIFINGIYYIEANRKCSTLCKYIHFRTKLYVL
jgi:hypothetical protein